MGIAEQERFDDFLDLHIKKPPPLVPSPIEKVQVVDIVGKGRSILAKQRLVQGERIFVEQPLCVISTLQHSVNDPLAVDEARETSIRSSVHALTAADQDAFQDLHSADPNSPYPFTRRFLTNALPCQGTEFAAVYRTACMINHSCEANAYALWDKEAQILRVNAIHDIEQGTELLFDYVPCLQSAERKAKFKAQFDFQCKCAICSLPSQKQRESDARRAEFLKLSKSDRSTERVMKSPETCMTECHRMITLIGQEFATGSAVEVLNAEVYECASDICRAHGDLARASVFKQREEKARRIFQGSLNETEAQQGQSGDVFGSQDQAQGPQSMRTPRKSKWQSQLNDIPKGLNERKFNKWLWRGS